MKTLPPGFEKVTYKDVEMMRDPSGMLWELNPTKRCNHYDALDFVKDTDFILPSKYDFFRLLGYFDSDDAFFEIFPWKDKSIWSSSAVPGDSLYAFDFNGRNGYIGNVPRYHDDGLVARCAGRR